MLWNFRPPNFTSWRILNGEWVLCEHMLSYRKLALLWLQLLGDALKYETKSACGILIWGFSDIMMKFYIFMDNGKLMLKWEERLYFSVNVREHWCVKIGSFLHYTFQFYWGIGWSVIKLCLAVSLFCLCCMLKFNRILG